MSEALARIIATAIEGARELDRAEIRAIAKEVVVQELASAGRGATAAPAGWASPPAGAKFYGVPTKRVRALMERGLVEKRPKNDASRFPKWEINLASLGAALQGERPAEPVQPVDAASWAAARAKKRSA